ncbi:MAG: LAGLIDADG family homing endonuclease [Candidatus Bathyarchaeia archaeon]
MNKCNNPSIGRKPLQLDHSHPKSITSPKQSCELAEFLGIYYGDGSATENPPVVTVSLSYSDEYVYARYVSELVREVFGVNAGFVEHKIVNNIQVRVYRISLVRYLKTTADRSQGVPNWVKCDSGFLSSFIRGVMDCESSVYRVERGKKRIRLELKMTNKRLLQDVHMGLYSLGYHPRIYLKRNRVTIARQNEVDRYFKEICSHNPKHMKRYLSLREKPFPKLR